MTTTPPPFSTRCWSALGVRERGRCARGLVLRVGPSVHLSTPAAPSTRASQLRDRRLLVRPLYVANGLMAFGLSLFPGIWYLPIILALATWLYYERIAIREEAFLAERFGSEFEAWSSRVAACWPSFAAYGRSAIPFSWKKVLRHEFHGLLVVAAGAFAFDAMQESWRARAWHMDAPWLWFFAASAVLFLIFAALKRGTRLLEG
jgi:hypothetical protein